MSKLLKLIIDKRIIILAIMGAGLYFLVSYLHISLLTVIIAGSITGIIFGKVFCRWVCPIGLVMELMMNLNPDTKSQQLYQYHKVGCPIAWISGFLNKYSVFKIWLDKSKCKDCGVCDKQCYIVAMEPTKYSLYKGGIFENPGKSYSCSKCLKCVGSCENNSLKYKVSLP